MDWYHLYQSSDGLYFSKTGAFFLSHDKRNRRIRDQSDNRRTCCSKDYCGVRSGRDVDKFKETGLTREKADIVKAPMIKEAPVSIECRVKEIRELGSHHMFLAEVVAVHADERYMDENNRFDLNRARPLVYSHGEYLGTGKKLGTFWIQCKKT